jgi:hypothetical protein
MASAKNTSTQPVLQVSFRGETLSLTEWAKRLGIKRRTLYTRIVVRGWSIEESLGEGVQSRNGRKKKPEYTNWHAMVSRCEPTARVADRYFRAGVTVCERWRDSFNAFYEDMGPKPSPKHQLDRFPDPKGNYEPGNVRWATPKENCRNRKSNVLITFNGITAPIAEHAEKAKLNFFTVWGRIVKRRWTPEKALTTPPQKHAGRN